MPVGVTDKCATSNTSAVCISVKRNFLSVLEWVLLLAPSVHRSVPRLALSGAGSWRP